MPWARLDDHFHGNSKVLKTSLSALGLYALGLSYCNEHLTDGQLTREAVASLHSGAKAAANELVRTRLWEVDPDGYCVHDYLQWNDSRELIEAQRDYDKLRKAGAVSSSPELQEAKARRDAARQRLETLRGRPPVNGTARFSRPRQMLVGSGRMTEA